MTTPTILPTQYDGTSRDYLKVKDDRSGASRPYGGSVSVPNLTAATTIVGLVPFNKGARFQINSNSVACGNFGAGSTTVDLGYVYDDNVTYTNNVDAWASAATAPQAGGFITVDEVDGISFVAEANGWIAVTINTTAADATAPITWNFTGGYDGLSLNNSNNQN